MPILVFFFGVVSVRMPDIGQAFFGLSSLSRRRDVKYKK